MTGAVVVILLAGLAFPISLLFAALVFDFAVVVWALFREWHDQWSPKLVSLAMHPLSRPHIGGGHRHRAAAAH